MNTHVIITTDFPGLHHWADAPNEVSFLRSPHRHLFHVKVSITEDHDRHKDSRETEFLLLKAFVDNFLVRSWPTVSPGVKDLGTTSCENIAAQIYEYLMNKGYAVDYVEVFEDGENGARVD